MSSITDELLLRLKSAESIDEFFEENKDSFIDMTSGGYLGEMLIKKEMSVSDVAKGSGVGEYAYKIFSGERKASRDVLIALSFGMKMSLEETQLLLRISKFAKLDSRDQRDSVIIFCLAHSKSIFETDDLLEEKGLATVAG